MRGRVHVAIWIWLHYRSVAKFSLRKSSDALNWLFISLVLASANYEYANFDMLPAVALGIVTGTIALVFAYRVLVPAAAGTLALIACLSRPGYWGVLFLHELDRRCLTNQEGRPLAKILLRMVIFGPSSSLRAFFVPYLAAIVAKVASDIRPSDLRVVEELQWLAGAIAVTGFGLLVALAGRGARLRHPSEASIGGNTVLYAGLTGAVAVTGIAAAAGLAVPAPLLAAAAGGVAVAAWEVLLRSWSAMRVGSAPLGYERDIILLASNTNGPKAFIQRRSYYDPHLHDDVDELLSRTLIGPDSVFPEYDWGRATPGTENLARALIFTFWGIESPHPADVLLFAALLLRFAPDKDHCIPFAEIAQTALRPERLAISDSI